MEHGNRYEEGQQSIIVAERLAQAIANFDDEGINGVEADDRVAAVLEAVHQAHVGMITHEEMVSSIERALGGKLETDADFTPDKSARLSFSSAGATRQRKNKANFGLGDDPSDDAVAALLFGKRS